MKVPGKFNMQAHISGSILVYVCVLNGHSSSKDPNATALRNQGKCQGNVFQGVPGGRFWETSKCELLPLPVNVGSDAQKEMSEKGLPGGQWRKVPGRFRRRALTEGAVFEYMFVFWMVTSPSYT